MKLFCHPCVCIFISRINLSSQKCLCSFWKTGTAIVQLVLQRPRLSERQYFLETNHWDFAPVSLKGPRLDPEKNLEPSLVYIQLLQGHHLVQILILHLLGILGHHSMKLKKIMNSNSNHVQEDCLQNHGRRFWWHCYVGDIVDFNPLEPSL